MLLIIGLWFAFVGALGAYIFSRPRGARIWFDAVVILLVCLIPVLFYFDSHLFAVDEQDYLETLGFLAILVPFRATVVAVPLLFLAALCRFFIYRDSTAGVVDTATPTV